MRILVVNTDYTRFVSEFYEADAKLQAQSFGEQMRQRFATQFGLSDFYSQALLGLGHEAQDVIMNLAPAQLQWAKENGIPVVERKKWRLHKTRIGVSIPVFKADVSWMLDVLEAQIKSYRPDVLYCMCIEDIGTEFIYRVRPNIRLAVGQHAAPHSRLDIAGFDLILSSLPNYVEHYRSLGIASEVLKLGFAPRVMRQVIRRPKRHDVVFIGGIGGPHDRRTRDLERMCERLPMKVWGYGIERLRRNSPIKACHQGVVWGNEMYQTLADAKVVFNQHMDISEAHANNMRLYETTGVGSFLLTDAKSNLKDLFEIPTEVASYRDIEDCIRLAAYYLSHDDERERVAAQGRARTLQDHTYDHRMQEVIRIVDRHISRSARK
jgi:spore maturation protein CgeB